MLVREHAFAFIKCENRGTLKISEITNWEIEYSEFQLKEILSEDA